VSELDDRAFLGRGWAFPMAADGNDADLVAYEEDVRQAIRIILGTNQGERVMRPDFGAGLRALTFEPLSTTTLAMVRLRTEQALIAWEPRIDLRAVRVSIDPATPGRLLVTIDYVVRRTNTFYNLVYPFYLQEGRP
jgi:uncharacterized protein